LMTWGQRVNGWWLFWVNIYLLDHGCPDQYHCCYCWCWLTGFPGDGQAHWAPGPNRTHPEVWARKAGPRW
jgi:hypothetical protein